MPPSAFTAGGSADYRPDLPLDRLLPGPHLFTFQATAGTRTSRRHVRVEVQRSDALAFAMAWFDPCQQL